MNVPFGPGTTRNKAPKKKSIKTNPPTHYTPINHPPKGFVASFPNDPFFAFFPSFSLGRSCGFLGRHVWCVTVCVTLCVCVSASISSVQCVVFFAIPLLEDYFSSGQLKICPKRFTKTGAVPVLLAGVPMANGSSVLPQRSASIIGSILGLPRRCCCW